jgi:hypothetical protein
MPRLIVNADRRRSMRPHQVAWRMLATLGGAMAVGGLVTWLLIVLKADRPSFDGLALPLLDEFAHIGVGLGLVAAATVSLDRPRAARAVAVMLGLTGACVLVPATLVGATELLGDGMGAYGRDLGNLAIAVRATALALFLLFAAVATWRYAGDEGEPIV